ncbi:hypothetical protein [Absidia glauca]|uniref:Uncharacterized protein n=1 Tax=Absidia glauca TaxID=4829 RepID=A0A168PP66_ABSGL|nr:hypothetical protein [Absidia glauca]
MSLPNDHKGRLTEEVATWTKSTDAIDFWKEMKLIDKLLTANSRSLLGSADTSADQDSPATTSEPDSETVVQDNHPTPPFPSANRYSTSNNEDSSEWILNGTNVTDLFKRSPHKIKNWVAEKKSFQAESDIQEVFAMSNIPFLSPNQHSDLSHATMTRFMDNLKVDFSMQEVSDLAHFGGKWYSPRCIHCMLVTLGSCINGSELDVVVVDLKTGKKVTTPMAKTMGPAQAAVVRGLANLNYADSLSTYPFKHSVVKLPTREIVDLDSLGETELQSTYFDPVLAPLFSNPQQNVVLRWANKNEEVSNIRPDAVISTIIQSKYGRPLGFGEVKPGNSSTNKHKLCMDTLRLATLSKDTIDSYDQQNCFTFQINGFRVSFFIIQKQHTNLYTMVEVATLVFPNSLNNLDTLVTKKNLSTLARASSLFWNNSTIPTCPPAFPSPRLPISTLYQIIGQSHNRNAGTTSRY